MQKSTQKQGLDYGPDWYVKQSKGSASSAHRVVPIVMELINPKSVLDVGCGVGTWLRVFSELGVETVLGLDGDYVDRSLLQIDQNNFVPTNLRSGFVVERQFDLAICLEVAEHLPSENGAGLVEQLVRSAPCVLFSAAIPGQRGTEHINEQWQDYWRELFQGHGYAAVDFIRPKIWGMKDVESWYQQNTLLYCNEESLRKWPELMVVDREISLNVVHPDIFNQERAENVDYLSKSLLTLPGLVASAVSRRLGIKDDL